jgi:cold shock CspA family protein
MSTAVLQGTISRIPDGKRFGFIVDPMTTERARGVHNDYFFHASDVITGRFEDLTAGDRVRFVPEETPKGKRATKVEYLGHFSIHGK